ncbi:MAG: hypothetical protein CSA36_05230 [Draconibacterium sp.]|nr:MAG: hypothetical protein CSA36_05230 [Draconibacterium sp.]
MKDSTDKIKYILIFILAGTLFSQSTFAQDNPQKVRVSGFLEYLNNTWIPDNSYSNYGIDSWQNQTGIYNRFNLWYNPSANFEVYMGMRNNFVFGPTITLYNHFFQLAGTDYNKLITNDNGYFNLTFLITNDDAYALYTNFDRANFKWTWNKFELTFGRQRINWGQNLIWNPNDIFNAYNFFDFNYIERPGADAILMELYTGEFSSIQLAGKLGYVQTTRDTSALILNKKLKLTTAAMYRFNLWNYDFQAFGGVMEDDITAGLGWAGSIAGAGFTGEVSWFREMNNFWDTSGVWVASIGANYTFRNSIFINFSAICNSGGLTDFMNKADTHLMGSFATMFSQNLNAKNLIHSRLNLFGQISYPATPLINLDLACIFNPYDLSGFVGPTANFSLTDNIALALVGQIFWGKTTSEYGNIGQMYFLDLKWSF